MPQQPFLIAAPKVGLERDLEPWLLPNDAYPELQDCYLWRGRIKKKSGYRILDRLHRTVFTVTGAPAATASFTIGGVSAATPLTPGQSKFIWNGVIFVDQVGVFPAGTFIFTTGGAASTINYNTGAVTLNLTAPAAINTTVEYYPGLPVMGLPTLENTVRIDSGITNKEILMAFDTKFSYLFDGTTLQFIDKSFYRTAGNPEVTWTGTDANFFWSVNYLNCMWSTNFVPGFQNNPIATTPASGDGIRWFDQAQSGWINFLPPVNNALSQFLMGALILLPYKGRLIALNTWEGANYAGRQNFPQRARWSQIGSPFAPAAAAVPTGFAALGGTASNTAWVSDVPGFGGFFDAPTLEMIVSAQFVKDTLIVFFESSTWQLRYTGNELLPFAWEKINTELGASSTFSEVPFDKIVIGIGDVGIHGCDSVNVERIDQKIPNEVFAIQNAQVGRARVYGIRDYYNQLVYWAMPYVGPDQQQDIDDDQSELPPSGIPVTYPNKILVYNYVEQSYSFFNDSFTCFGYYNKADGDLTWQQATDTWEEAEYQWIPTTYQESFPFVVTGNQQGYVEIIDPEVILNDQSLMISAVDISIVNSPLITVLNHNLTVGTIIRIRNGSDTITFYKITVVVSANQFRIDGAYPGTFAGDAEIFVVSNINIITKKFNPYINEGSQVRLNYIDYYLENTDAGEITTNIYLNDDPTLPTNRIVVASFAESTYTTSPDTTPYAPQKLWKRAYYDSVSQFFQVQITLSQAQRRDLNIISSDIVLHGLILYFDTAGRLIDV